MNMERSEGGQADNGRPHLEEIPSRQLHVVSEAQERGWAGQLEWEQSKGSRMDFPTPGRKLEQEEASRETGNIPQGVRTGRACCRVPRGWKSEDR